MKILLAVIVLLASPALAADPQFIHEDKLFQTDSTKLNSDTGLDCFSVDRYGGLNASACEAEWLSSHLFEMDAVITRMTVDVDLTATTAGGTCIVTMQDYSHDAYPDMCTLEFATDALGRTECEVAEPFILDAYSRIEFAFGTTGYCNDAAQDVEAIVTLHGYWLVDVK